MSRKKKKNQPYKIPILPGDTVFAPASRDVYRKAKVIDSQLKNDNTVFRIEFESTGTTHFISAELCYRVLNGIIVPLEKPTNGKQKFCIWLVRKFGLIEV
ncbi:MAG: hypothetical protein GX270_07495 [Clostridiaceae bacterium]|jgi:hypothetical protein|nr:hypothetical protein [Clostridiaceae bacterium]